MLHDFISRTFGGTGRPQPASVLSLGQIWVDVMMDVNEMPPAGGFAAAKQINSAIGGSFRVLQAAKRMGSPAQHAGIIGSGLWGAAVRKALAHDGIEHIGQDRLDSDTGFRLVLNDGERKTFIATYGAESGGDSDCFDGVKPTDGDVVHISGNTLMDHSAAGIEALFDRTMLDPDARPYTIVLNPTNTLELVSDQLLENLVLARPIWSCNRQEAHTLADRLGVPRDESTAKLTVGGAFDDAMEQLCGSLGEALRATLVLRAGARGAWVREPGGTVTHVPGFPVKPVHTRSAGACHTGAFCAMLAQGWSLLDAVRIANAAASLAIEHHVSGVPDCPDRQGALALVAAAERGGAGENDGADGTAGDGGNVGETSSSRQNKAAEGAADGATDYRS
ncbi:PfkB family carbohydrate kinase [Bifidobacterium sp.]|jgi:sugar/nucleoside kinase (ribokinase family)|uniref:PfkB family carbohydrate kinase n=1 Tax=Bifidobacterium sp. TaxID=41200 RepID=UPI0025BCBDD3|nr:PfkB family carbohydrate kinase [Bifidobacterium sp.]MCH4208931.1 PfkB family carbohydrate kinase [Bifidobacterium sp.]MCI1224478.1 PfkB family carbohydrate kinase [Bifidobacterium sp.]